MAAQDVTRVRTGAPTAPLRAARCPVQLTRALDAFATFAREGGGIGSGQGGVGRCLRFTAHPTASRTTPARPAR